MITWTNVKAYIWHLCLDIQRFKRIFIITVTIKLYWAKTRVRLPPMRAGFDSSAVHVRYVVIKVALGQVFLRVRPAVLDLAGEDTETETRLSVMTSHHTAIIWTKETQLHWCSSAQWKSEEFDKGVTFSWRNKRLMGGTELYFRWAVSNEPPYTHISAEFSKQWPKPHLPNNPNTYTVMQERPQTHGAAATHKY